MAKKLQELALQKRQKQGHLYPSQESQASLSAHPLLFDAISFSDDPFDE